MTVSSDGKITPAEAIKPKRRDSSAHDTINLISSAVDSLNRMSHLLPSDSGLSTTKEFDEELAKHLKDQGQSNISLVSKKL